MSAVAMRLAASQARDALRSRWIVVYTGFFLLLTEGLLRFSGGDAKARAEPGDGQPHGDPARHARALDDLRLQRARVHRAAARATGQAIGALRRTVSRPRAADRRRLRRSASGCRSPFAAAAIRRSAARSSLLLLVGAALTLAFTAIAFCIALRAEDRLRGVALALGAWLLVVGRCTTGSCSPPSRCSPTTRSSGRCSR